MITIKCDLHTHTLYSAHAYSTIEENVREAEAVGLELIASTDHFSSMVVAEDEDLRSYQFFTNQGCWRRYWHNVKVLRGCEVDIVNPDGYLFGMGLPIKKSIVGDPYKDDKDLFQRTTERLDFIIASVHGKWGLQGITKNQATQMYITVLEDPRILMLGHIGRAGIPFETDEVLNRAKELHKPIEINEHSVIWSGDVAERCKKIAERCAELGVSVCVNTDAHIATDVGRFPTVIEMLEEIHFPQELIMNRDSESFLDQYYEAGFPKIDFSEDDIK